MGDFWSKFGKGFQSGMDKGAEIGAEGAKAAMKSGGSEYELMRLLLGVKEADARQNRFDSSQDRLVNKEERSEMRSLAKEMAPLAKGAASTAAAAKSLETASPEVKKGIGAVTWIPQSLGLRGYAMGAGEMLGVLPEGTQSAFQDIQGQANEAMKVLAGTAVSGAEEARQLLAQGLQAGNEQLIKQGLDRANELFRQEAAVKATGYEEPLVNKFKERGKDTALRQLLMPQPQPASQGITPQQSTVVKPTLQNAPPKEEPLPTGISQSRKNGKYYMLHPDGSGEEMIKDPKTNTWRKAP